MPKKTDAFLWKYPCTVPYLVSITGATVGEFGSAKGNRKLNCKNRNRSLASRRRNMARRLATGLIAFKTLGRGLNAEYMNEVCVSLFVNLVQVGRTGDCANCRDASLIFRNSLISRIAVRRKLAITNPKRLAPCTGTNDRSLTRIRYRIFLIFRGKYRKNGKIR